MDKATQNYIQQKYGVPARRGVRVRIKDSGHILSLAGTCGTITDASGHWLRVRPDEAPSKRYRLTLHPLDVDYLTDNVN